MKTQTVLFFCAVLAACGGSNAHSKTVTSSCATGSHLCTCFGNDTCDGKLTCVLPEQVCATEAEAQADGGIAAVLVGFGREVDAGSSGSLGRVDGGTGGQLDGGAPPRDGSTATADAGPGDGSTPVGDAAAALPHELFIGKWTCTETDTTDSAGRILNPPRVSINPVEITAGYDVRYGTAGIDLFIYAFTRFDSNTLVASKTNANAGATYTVQLRSVAADALSGAYTVSSDPKMQASWACTRK